MRSKILLVSNILSTIYTACLLWIFGGAIIAAGGLDYIEYCQQAFGVVFDLFGFSSASVNAIYAVIILMAIHISAFTIGAIFGWIGYFAKKSGWAKFAATLYLLGTLSFLLYIFWSLPITIIGFVGGSKQKKLNTSVA
ncbi:MAG: hypothetical protein IKW06_06610 [Clostridia bacterium]|nr:hypothetical protein [Clostridia bacterium]